MVRISLVLAKITSISSFLTYVRNFEGQGFPDTLGNELSIPQRYYIETPPESYLITVVLQRIAVRLTLAVAPSPPKPLTLANESLSIHARLESPHLAVKSDAIGRAQITRESGSLALY